MAHKPSVLIVSHFALPHTGGIEQVVDTQAKALNERNFHVSIITTASHEDVPGRTKTSEGIPIIRLRAVTLMERKFFIPFPIIGIRGLRTLWNTIKHHDVVHVHDVFYEPCWFAVLFARLQKKTVYMTQHVALVKHKSPVVTFVQKMVYTLFGKHMMRVSKKVIVYNEIVEQFLKNFLQVPKKKILHIKNGVDIHTYSPGTPEENIQYRRKYNLPTEKSLVLFVGRFVSKKGFKEVYGARDDAYDIVFVGSGSVPKEWYSANGIHILGKRTPEEVAELYKAVDIFVSPTHGELFTLTMQEALASGLPVITTGEKAYDSYTLDQRGIVFCTPESATLKRELIALVNDDERRAYMQHYSRELALSLFDAKKNIQDMLSIYEKGSSEHAEKMHIAHVSAFYPPHVGGLETVVKELAHATAVKGYHVDVYTSDIGAKEAPKKETRGNLTVHRLPGIELLYVPIIWSLFLKLVTLPKKSIIHVHMAHALVPDVAFLASKIRRIPIVAHFHLDFDPPSTLGKLFALYKTYIQKYVLTCADTVVVFSETQKENVITRYGVQPGKVVIVPNGVGEEYFSDTPKEQIHTPLRLLTVSRLSTQKCLDRLIRAMSYLPFPAELTIVGEGELRKQLEELAHKICPGNIYFVGSKTAKEIMHYHKESDIFLTSSDAEGMPLAVLEAMAAGLPVIGTRVVGITELVDTAGVLVDAPYEKNFAREIENIVHHTDVFQRLSSQSIAQAKELTWEQSASLVEDIYTNIDSVK